MANAFGFTSLTGGGVGALDAIDGAVISVGDLAFGSDATDTYSFICDGSGDAESSPDTIAPDSNAGVKRWKRRHDESKAYRAATPTNGHLAELDADGDLVDSGLVSTIFDDLGTLTGDKGLVPVVKTAETGYEMMQIPGRNLLINGCFRIFQRGTSFTSATNPANSDDTALADRWFLLSDGNDIVDVTQSTERPTTKFLKSIALDVETANKKFGIVQFVENQNAEFIIGDTVTFSFYAKASETTKLDNVKAAIIAWDGAADTVTSDIVSAWNAENTAPTLVANWTYENVPANLSVTNAWARYSVSATIDTASTTNVAVFIWSDVTDTTAGHFLYITGCQLELGSTPTTFEYRPFSTELTLCQRYYESSYDLGTAIGTVSDNGAIGGSVAGNVTTYHTMFFKTTKRILPTVITYSPATGTSGQVRNVSGGADIAVSAVLYEGKDSAVVAFTSGGAIAFYYHYVALAEM